MLEKDSTIPHGKNGKHFTTKCKSFEQEKKSVYNNVWDSIESHDFDVSRLKHDFEWWIMGERTEMKRTNATC